MEFQRAMNLRHRSNHSVLMAIKTWKRECQEVKETFLKKAMSRTAGSMRITASLTAHQQQASPGDSNLPGIRKHSHSIKLWTTILNITKKLPRDLVGRLTPGSDECLA